MRMKLISSPLSFWIGLRYLAAKRRNHFISFISASSMVGMTLGVAVLILVLSVMNGFDRELRERILGMVPHAVIYERGGIQNWQSLAAEVEQMPGVAGVAPLTRLQGMRSDVEQIQRPMITCIDSDAEKNVSIMPNHINSCDLYNLQAGKNKEFLINLLARQLKVDKEEKVTL